VKETNEQNRIRVLAIMGSPRRGGNTDIMLDEVLSGAAEAGALTEKVMLTDLDIGPCLACDACVRDRKCAQRDDMAGLLAQMERSQVWVLGTPVYWWGPSAQLKTFVDRWYGGYRTFSFPGRRVVLVIPFGDTDPETARHTVGMMQDSLDYVKIELAAVVLAAGANDRGEVLGQPEVLAAARQAGRDVVLSSRR
jgi:multimeric flavodoxin WrbA